MPTEAEKFVISVTLDKAVERFLSIIEKGTVPLNLNIISPDLKKIDTILTKLERLEGTTININFRATGLEAIEERIAGIRSKAKSGGGTGTRAESMREADLRAISEQAASSSVNTSTVLSNLYKEQASLRQTLNNVKGPLPGADNLLYRPTGNLPTVPPPKPSSVNSMVSNYMALRDQSLRQEADIARYRAVAEDSKFIYDPNRKMGTLGRTVGQYKMFREASSTFDAINQKKAYEAQQAYIQHEVASKMAGDALNYPARKTPGTDFTLPNGPIETSAAMKAKEAPFAAQRAINDLIISQDAIKKFQSSAVEKNLDLAATGKFLDNVEKEFVKNSAVGSKTPLLTPIQNFGNTSGRKSFNSDKEISGYLSKLESQYFTSGGFGGGPPNTPPKGPTDFSEEGHGPGPKPFPAGSLFGGFSRFKPAPALTDDEIIENLRRKQVQDSIRKREGEIVSNRVLNKAGLGRDEEELRSEIEHEALLSKGYKPSQALDILGPRKKVSTFDVKNRVLGEGKEAEATRQQVLFATLFGGASGGVVGAATAGIGATIGGAATGAGGAFLGSTIAQSAIGTFTAVFETIAKTLERVAEAGKEYQKSILAIGSVLNANTTVFTSSGAEATPQQSIAFNSRKARSIQQLARPRLAPLGIAGEAESSLVQAIVAGAAQKGIILNPEQAATLAERIGAAAQSQRPELLQNPGLIRRDVEDILAGLPQGSRTALGSTIRPFIKKAGAATSGEDLVKASESLQGFVDAVRNTDSAVVTLNKLSGALSNIQQTVGDRLLQGLNKGLGELANVISDPKFSAGAAQLAGDLGKVGGALASVGAFFLKGAVGEGKTELTKEQYDKQDPFSILTENLKQLLPGSKGFIGEANERNLPGLKLALTLPDIASGLVDYFDRKGKPKEEELTSGLSSKQVINNLFRKIGQEAPSDESEILPGFIKRSADKAISELPDKFGKGETLGDRLGSLANISKANALGERKDFEEQKGGFLQGNIFSEVRSLRSEKVPLQAEFESANDKALSTRQKLTESVGELDKAKNETDRLQKLISEAKKEGVDTKFLETKATPEALQSRLTESVASATDKAVKAERDLGAARVAQIQHAISLTSAERKVDEARLAGIDSFTESGQREALSARRSLLSKDIGERIPGLESDSDKRIAELNAKLSKEAPGRVRDELLNQVKTEQEAKAQLGVESAAKGVEIKGIDRSKELENVNRDLDLTQFGQSIKGATDALADLADKSFKLKNAFEDFSDNATLKSLDQADQQQELFNKVSKAPGGLFKLREAGLSTEDINRLSLTSDTSGIFGEDATANRELSRNTKKLSLVTKGIARQPEENARDFLSLKRDRDNTEIEKTKTSLGLDKTLIDFKQRFGDSRPDLVEKVTTQANDARKAAGLPPVGADFGANLPGSVGNPLGVTNPADNANLTLDKLSGGVAKTGGAMDALTVSVLAAVDALNKMAGTNSGSLKNPQPNQNNVPPADRFKRSNDAINDWTAQFDLFQ